MKSKHWRRLAALVIFSLFAIAYFLPESVGDKSRKIVLLTQLSPSLTRFGPRLALAGVILASVVLLGRWYCSVLCPAGLVQELFHRIGGWLGVRRLRYVPAATPRFRLFLIVLATLAGTAALANFLDPIGLYGRLAVPAGASIRALIGGTGASEWRDTAALVAVLAGAAFLIAPSLFRGRWFCDALCPVGAVLGLCGSAARRNVRMDPGKCVSCGQCERICPTRCQDAKNRKMDAERCVVCLDCVDACDFGALSYGRGQRNVPEGEGRRNFLNASASFAAGGLFVFSRPLMGSLAMIPDDPALPVLPPGTEGANHHKRSCVSCQSCVLSCPVGIIQPQSPDMRPVLDYDRGYCQYNCVACNVSCPSQTFRRLTLEQKQTTRIGTTTLELDRCVVVVQKNACGACAEVCPTHAVRMRSQGPGLPTIPDFDPRYCIGCGACYHVCPAEPRAFQVEGVDRQSTTPGVRPGGHDAVDADIEPAGSPDDLTEFPF